MKIEMNTKIKLVHFLLALLWLVSLASLVTPTAYGSLNQSIGQNPSKNSQVSFSDPVKIVDNRQDTDLVWSGSGYGIAADRWFWRLNPSDMLLAIIQKW